MRVLTHPNPQLDLTGTGFCPSFNFRRAARAVTRLFDQAFAGTGIRSTQFTILVAVAKTQPVAIGRVGEILVLDPTTLSRSLRLMKNQGLITLSERSARRQRFLALTEKGQRLLARALPVWRSAQERFVGAVGPAYWLDLRSELEKVAQLAVGLEEGAAPEGAG